MDPSVWSTGMYSSSSICTGDCTEEKSSSSQPDPLSVSSDVPGVSMNLNKDSKKIKMLSQKNYCSSSNADSRLPSSSRLGLNPFRDFGFTSTKRHQSPASSSCSHDIWKEASGHQAKRARVENIIKGMHCTDVMTNHDESDGMEGNESVQDLDEVRSGCMSWSHDERKRTRLNHMDAVKKTSDGCEGETHPSWNACADSYREFKGSSRAKYHEWKKLMNHYQSKPERLILTADVLKYELSKALNRSIDSIFKSISLLQTSSAEEWKRAAKCPAQKSLNKDRELSCCGDTNVQTEALSLVVQKPRLESDNKFILQATSRADHGPESQILFSDDSAPQHENHQFPPRSAGDNAGQVHFQTLDGHLNTIKVRSKVNSRSVRRQHFHSASMDSVLLESLCLPHVKIESDGLVKSNLYMLNEGLTTSHLKKAKLMFFYTRYPSSVVLNMCFYDVQFTRCITSQLIKWFSNFREFFYIQMEKFARHALMEGLNDVRSLTVGRESELFRALNLHYNKSNDFQVPDRFLEVSEITLREFFIAISMGKDQDPSWKKAIYKVICKLDSNVPAEFKHHHTP